jgi:hypothetical protein
MISILPQFIAMAAMLAVPSAATSQSQVLPRQSSQSSYQGCYSSVGSMQFQGLWTQPVMETAAGAVTRYLQGQI